MDSASVRSARLRSHRLSAPAPTVVAAAEHMLATQAQEFWGGRWALASRAKGAPTLGAVDAAFERGELIRSWTMRGTLHILAAKDLGWMLSITRDRQSRQWAQAHRVAGIEESHVRSAERAVRAALAGGNRLTRREFADVLAGAGIETAGLRGNFLLSALCLRTVICLGPVVPRAGAPSRDQHIVLADEWITDAAAPADPLAEFFTRYIASHGPAGVRDFAWWANLPLGVARKAAEAASDRLDEVDEGLFVSRDRPRRSPSPEVFALPPYEEYHLSYADRSLQCAEDFRRAIGPTMNGIVRPVLVARGEVVGVWAHSLAVGAHGEPPTWELLAPGAASAEEVDQALARYRAFLDG
jgi:hypothetical protein